MSYKIKGIILAGKMGSGKTTLANWIIEKHEHYHKFSMAQGIKELAANHYNNGNPVDKAGTYKIFNRGVGEWEDKSGREIFQGIGEAIKTFDYSFWFADTECRIKDLATYIPELHFVIDDCRFKEEYEYFKEKFDVTLVYVHSMQEDLDKRAMDRDGRVPTHSEKTNISEIVDWASQLADQHIYNVTSLDKFLECGEVLLGKL